LMKSVREGEGRLEKSCGHNPYPTPDIGDQWRR